MGVNMKYWKATILLFAAALLLAACSGGLADEGAGEGKLRISLIMPDFALLSSAAVENEEIEVEEAEAASKVIAPQTTHIRVALDSANLARQALSSFTVEDVEGQTFFKEYSTTVSVPAGTYGKVTVKLQEQYQTGYYRNISQMVAKGADGASSGGITIPAGGSATVYGGAVPSRYWTIKTGTLFDSTPDNNNATLAAKNMNFLRFAVTTGQIFSAEATSGDVSLYVIDALGKLRLDESTGWGTTKVEFSIAQDDPTGYWYLGVYSESGGDYQIMLSAKQTTAATGPVINEACFSWWPEAIEIANPTASELDLDGYRLRIQNYGFVAQDVTLHPGVPIPAGGYLVVLFAQPGCPTNLYNSNLIMSYDPTPGDSTNGDAIVGGAYKAPEGGVYYVNYVWAVNTDTAAGFYADYLNTYYNYLYANSYALDMRLLDSAGTLQDYIRVGYDSLAKYSPPDGCGWPSSDYIGSWGVLSRYVTTTGLPADSGGALDWRKYSQSLGAPNDVAGSSELGCDIQ